VDRVHRELETLGAYRIGQLRRRPRRRASRRPRGDERPAGARRGVHRQHAGPSKVSHRRDPVGEPAAGTPRRRLAARSPSRAGSTSARIGRVHAARKHRHAADEAELRAPPQQQHVKIRTVLEQHDVADAPDAPARVGRQRAPVAGRAAIARLAKEEPIIPAARQPSIRPVTRPPAITPERRRPSPSTCSSIGVFAASSVCSRRVPGSCASRAPRSRSLHRAGAGSAPR
jgi:hypothetical protein